MKQEAKSAGEGRSGNPSRNLMCTISTLVAPEGDKAKALGAAGAVVPHDARIGAVADVLEGLQQHRVCHIAAEVADKDVGMRACVLALLFLEGPLDAHFLAGAAAAEKGPSGSGKKSTRAEAIKNLNHDFSMAAAATDRQAAGAKASALWKGCTVGSG